MIMTSGYNIEGYDIVSYLGHESAQVVLGTGFFSATSVAIADLFGSTSNAYEDKLNDAEQLAKKRLRSRATAMGGNAIIGIDVDYTVFVNDVMGVIVNGTVVKIEKINSENTSNGYCIPVFSYMDTLPFNICNIELIQNQFSGKIKAVVDIINYNNENNIGAFIGDIEFEDILGNAYNVLDLIFVLDNENANQLCSLDLPMDNIRLNIIKKAYIKVRKYILVDSEEVKLLADDEYHKSLELTVNDLKSLRDIIGKDVVCRSALTEDNWRCYCGATNEKDANECLRCKRPKAKISLGSGFDIEKFYMDINNISTTKELLDIVVNMEIPKKDIIIEELKQTISIERIYGKMVDAAKKKVKKILEE